MNAVVVRLPTARWSAATASMSRGRFASVVDPAGATTSSLGPRSRRLSFGERTLWVSAHHIRLRDGRSLKSAKSAGR
jgi:hypothetical protein